MRVIEHGDRALHDGSKEVRCARCGCLFVVEKGDYWQRVTIEDDVRERGRITGKKWQCYFMTKCPECQEFTHHDHHYKIYNITGEIVEER